jgi:hypothetical protein
MKVDKMTDIAKEGVKKYYKDKIDALNIRIEQAQREADLETVADLKYGKIPELLKEQKSALKYVNNFLCLNKIINSFDKILGYDNDKITNRSFVIKK